jgi:dTDP-4-dehydrorhamnose reductase
MVKKSDALTPIIFGASGLLGRYLHIALRQSFSHVLATFCNNAQFGLYHYDFRNCSLSDLQLDESRDYVAIICGAVTNISFINDNPNITSQVNVGGVLRLVDELLTKQIPVVFISSDNVFSGYEGAYEENSVCQPVSEYGRQKLVVEQALIQSAHPVCVIRLAKIMGNQPDDGTIINDITRQLLSGENVKAASDLIFNPTAVEDIGRAVEYVIKEGITGLRNFCNPEVFSRLTLTYAIADALGVDCERVDPVLFADIDPSGKRPLNTTMVNSTVFSDFTFTSVASCIKKVARYWKN